MQRQHPIRCDLWVLAIDELQQCDLESFMTSRERARLSRFNRRDDRLRHAGSRALLRAAVADRLGGSVRQVDIGQRCENCGSHEHGRPHVSHHGLHVSISHSESLAIVAITDEGPIGVDVEWRNDARALRPVAAHIVGPDEVTPTTPETFFRMWCRKEAVVKALGVGLAMPMKQVQVSTPEEPAKVMLVGGQPSQLSLCDLELGSWRTGYTGAVAVMAGGTIEPQIFDGARTIEQALIRERGSPARAHPFFDRKR